MTNLETRTFEVRATNTDKREVSGLAVPYDTPTNIGRSYVEKIARGAVQDSESALLYWRHDEPIGKITASRDTDAGWEITAHISETPRGDEAYTLLRDGVIDKFSIGFEPIEHREDEDGTVVRTRIRVREVSLVPFPAYDGAKVAQVREADNTNTKVNMTDNTVSNADLTEVRTAIEDLERKVETGLSARDAEP